MKNCYVPLLGTKRRPGLGKVVIVYSRAESSEARESEEYTNPRQ